MKKLKSSWVCLSCRKGSRMMIGAKISGWLDCRYGSIETKDRVIPWQVYENDKWWPSVPTWIKHGWRAPKTIKIVQNIVQMEQFVQNILKETLRRLLSYAWDLMRNWINEFIRYFSCSGVCLLFCIGSSVPIILTSWLKTLDCSPIGLGSSLEGNVSIDVDTKLSLSSSKSSST